MNMKEIFPGVLKKGPHIYTKNLAPGLSVYGEKRIKVQNVEYRFWNPFRSKLGAAIKKGVKNMPIRPGNKVLYLGAASGTTPSHVSDIVGEKGTVYGIEFAAIPMKKLVLISMDRKNIYPILGDARKPQNYETIVDKVDVIFEDVAQPDQSEILARNAEWYLKKGGYALLAVKARSIDVTKKPNEIFKQEEKKLKEYFKIVESIRLEPYEEDHIMFVCRW